MATGRHLVVVASADPPETDDLASRLRNAVAVRTAYDVPEVLTRLDPDVDVVLVDPALADGAVGTVQEAVTGRGLDCLVALLTDASPDGTGADAVVSPAVPDATLRRDVLDLAMQAGYRKTLEEYYDVARAAAQADESETDSERLRSRLDALAGRLQATAEPLDSTTLFRTALDVDVGHDTDPDFGLDTGLDAMPDADPEAGPDTGRNGESGTDRDAESGRDHGSNHETGPDCDADADSDAGVDRGHD